MFRTILKSISPLSCFYWPCCVQSVLSRPWLNILPVQLSHLVNKICVSYISLFQTRTIEELKDRYYSCITRLLKVNGTLAGCTKGRVVRTFINQQTMVHNCCFILYHTYIKEFVWNTFCQFQYIITWKSMIILSLKKSWDLERIVYTKLQHA